MDHDLGPDFKGKIHDPHLIVRRQMEEMRSQRSGELIFKSELPQRVARHEAEIARLTEENGTIKDRINQLIEAVNRLKKGQAPE